ncbi:MAG: hypothetical protein ACRD5G_14160, partial [Candidatus Acidiferrales bacterium]
MKRYATLLLILSLVAVLAPAGAAPQSSESLPTADQVLDRYVIALGGKAALQKLNSRVAKGTIELPEQLATGTVLIQSKAPNSGRYTIDIADFGKVEQSFDGAAGWADNPQTGLRDMTAEEIEYVRISSDFHAPLNMRQTYSGLAVKAKETLSGGQAYVLEGKQRDGRVRVMYFDAATGLLVRYVVERGTPEGPLKVDNYLEDYRQVDGIQFPHTQRQINPAFTS